MSLKKPVLFFTFANDHNGKFLEALRPEQHAINLNFAKWLDENQATAYHAATSQPKELLEGLNQFTGRLIIFHYSGHSDGKGLHLESTEGENIFFNGANLSNILEDEAKSGLKLVFLNACLTQGLAERFQDLGVPAIIATHASVSDIQAKNFSEAFYRSLISGNTLKTAFNQAKSILEPGEEKSRIFRSMVREKQASATEFPWGLYIQHDVVLNWKLKDETPKVPLAKSFPKELNFIPSLNPDFVGREKELQTLEILLHGKKPMLLLNGQGGIGKTTLAKQYVHKHIEKYDHIVWISVLEEPDKEEQTRDTAIQALANDQKLFENTGLELDIKEEENQRANLILKTLREVPGTNLLVIDNAERGLEALAPFLPQFPSWHVLITSRLELPAFETYRLDELDPQEAEELFIKLYPRGKRIKSLCRS